jgi:uncharacterized protein YecE (DUF72 family)
LKKPGDSPRPDPPERKARRQERRRKQREANMGRAAKMHRARLENPLPVSKKEQSVARRKFHVGCSGWFYWDWRGKFYPEDLPTKEWFPRYMRVFKTVELNAPFYSWPTVANVGAWRRQAGKKRFVYTVKVCELITHIKKFKGTKELIRDFGYIADLLGSRMGCFLFQLPPSFRYTRARLKSIVSQLDPVRRNVVEFRHESWWNEDVYKAFREAGIIFCSCSGPKLPEELIRTADDIYVRFHGTKKWYRHDYTLEELKRWAALIQQSGAKQVWAYFNNDYGGYAIKNAAQLLRLLEK